MIEMSSAYIVRWWWPAVASKRHTIHNANAYPLQRTTPTMLACSLPGGPINLTRFDHTLWDEMRVKYGADGVFPSVYAKTRRVMNH